MTETKNNENKLKKLGIMIAVIGAILILTPLLVLGWYKRGLMPKTNKSNLVTKEINIQPGTSTQNVVKQLDEIDVIKNKNAAKIYTFINRPIIQAGTFEISSAMSINEIFTILAKAEDETVWVTIPEGLRYDEIADIWAEEVEGFRKKEFNNLAENKLLSRDTAEGYLFPDTYNVKKEITEEQAFNLMYDNFQKKVGDISYDNLILASIVEREAKTDKERPIIAGILKKRLDTQGWLLQADATLLYMVKDWKATITQEMKESTSMYNTYYNPNLPPTPICNPGLKSIEAAKEPNTNTPYWFYIHAQEDNGSSKIYYAITQEEHNQNVRNYLW